VLTDLVMGRALFGITMAFHILFATLGVGIPLFISIAEGIGIAKHDPEWILIARRWTKAFVVLAAVGVVTGTIVGFNLTLLWPRFMQVAGRAIALPFFIEVFAFFLEAVFLGIYVYGWDRFQKPINHWLCSLPIVIGAALSGMLITTANSFMNAPRGFLWAHGQMTQINPITAMLNPATPTEVLHVLISAYLTAAFSLAAVPAYKLLRSTEHVGYYRKALSLTVGIGLVAAILTPILGDLSGKYLAEYQPEKLAAGEALFHTTANAPLVIGGIINAAAQTVTYGIHVPYMLSFLAYDDIHHKVLGLDAFARSTWPPLLVHYFFDGMVGIGTYLLGVAVLYLLALWRRLRNIAWLQNKLLYLLLLSSAPLSMLAIELGWLYDEIGRQPWIVVGYMKVSQAFTTAGNITPLFFIFITLYILLGAATIYVLRSYFRRHPVSVELAELKTRDAYGHTIVQLADRTMAEGDSP